MKRHTIRAGGRLNHRAGVIYVTAAEKAETLQRSIADLEAKQQVAREFLSHLDDQFLNHFPEFGG